MRQPGTLIGSSRCVGGARPVAQVASPGFVKWLAGALLLVLGACAPSWEARDAQNTSDTQVAAPSAAERVREVGARVFLATAALCRRAQPADTTAALDKGMAAGFGPLYARPASAGRTGTWAERDVPTPGRRPGEVPTPGLRPSGVHTVIAAPYPPAGAESRGVGSFRAGPGLPIIRTPARGLRRAGGKARAGCGLGLVLSSQSGANAFSHGNRIRVTRDMVRFADEDAELAFVLAHEVAHNLLGHRTSVGRSTRRRMELEADHVGLYLIARAGYDPRIAARLLRRLSVAQPEMGRARPNHPTFGSRFKALQEVIEEIDRKRASGRRLVPAISAGSLARDLS